MERYTIKKTEGAGFVLCEIFRSNRQNPVASYARENFANALNAAFNSIGISWNPAATSYIRTGKDKLSAIVVEFARTEKVAA